MKKLITIVSAFCALLLVSSCGSVAHHKQGIKLFNYSSDVTLKVDGVVTKAEQVYIASQGTVGGPQATFYGAGVKVDRKHSHTLTIQKNGKSVDIPLKSKVWVGSIFLNLGFGGGPIGIAIDASTGYIKNLKPKYIDVTYRLGESKKKGKGQLKRQFKRKVRRES